MLEILVSIIALLVTLGILVTIHEFGHFWVARRCGVKVLRFSIGFGRAAKSWVGKDGVEYVIAPIPLGGYVKMLGQDDTEVVSYARKKDRGHRTSAWVRDAEGLTSGDDAMAEQDGDLEWSTLDSVDARESVSASERAQSFAYKPLWQRMAIVAAGPVANFLLAIVVFWVIHLAYGVSGIAPVINGVIEDSPAAAAGLKAGDEIVAVDGQQTIIWQQVTLQMLGRMGESGDLTLTVDPADSSRLRDVRIPINGWMGGDVQPNPVSDLGIVQLEIPARIAEVFPGDPAALGGLQAADLVLSVNGEPVRGWSHWVDIIRSSPELSLDVVVQRGDNQVDLTLRPRAVELEDGSVIGSIGAAVQQATYEELVPPELRREIHYGPISAVGPALRETWSKSVFVLNSVKKMVVGLISVKNINGPITIAQVAGETASYGLDVYLGFLALLSISLGVFNLLPIPVLDGGHLFYYTIEAVIRRPVPERIQAWGLQLGLLLITSVMFLAIYNDVTRLL